MMPSRLIRRRRTLFLRDERGGGWVKSQGCKHSKPFHVHLLKAAYLPELKLKKRGRRVLTVGFASPSHWMGTVRFGECVWDPEGRELFRRGRTVHLQPKTYRLLEVLLEQRPAAISKEELIERIWPKVFVGDGNLARLVADLREAIGDDGEQPFIRTIRGFGYALRAEMGAKKAEPAEGPVFKLLWKDREIALSPGENPLGRDPRSVARVDVASVSRHHATIRID